jgi:hypothetical protein
MDGLLEGKAWVGFRKVEEFVKKDQKQKNNEVGKMVTKEHKQLTIMLSKNLDHEHDEPPLQQ